MMKETVFLDIGAAGKIPKNWFNKVFRKKSKIYAFDLDKEKNKNFIKDKSIDLVFLDKILSKEKTQRKFFILNSDTGSSFFKINEAFKKYTFSEYHNLKKEIIVQTETIENLIKNKQIEQPEVIKIDVQGGELDVLIGMGEYISKVNLIECEVEFTEVYKDQPLYNDVYEFMIKNNFELMSLKVNEVFHTNSEKKNKYISKVGGVRLNRHWRGKVYSGDAIFIRKTKFEELLDKQFLLNYLDAICIYGFFDRALQIIDDLKKDNQINLKDISQIKKQIYLASYSKKIFRRLVSKIIFFIKKFY